MPVPARPTNLRLSTGLTVAQEITAEATSANSDTTHPLPLMATWSVGTVWDDPDAPTRYSPAWQIQKISEGHHILPSFQMPDRIMLDPADAGNGSLLWPDHYQAPLTTAAALNLPISLMGTQWEQDLYNDSTWFGLAYASNPNMANVSTGAAIARLSAFGALTPWTEVGTRWVSSTNRVGGASMLSYLQTWYPNPPMVLFVSNNEALREYWHSDVGPDLEADKHFVDLYGTSQTDEFKREHLADGWIARYSAMTAAMRAGLPSGAWRTGAKFIGYNAFGPRWMGRWADWAQYSIYNTNRIDPNPLMFDGGSTSYYNNLDGWDTVVRSPQYELTNGVFVLEEAYALNPNFWFEISTWAGTDYFPLSNAPGGDTYAQGVLSHDPGYTPARYAAMAQFGMWLTRPRVVRHFTYYDSLLVNSQVYFDAVMAAVDRVYANVTLRTFWRQSTLVENTGRASAFQNSVPTEYATVVRSYVLTTTLDPNSGDASLWGTGTVLPVFAIARLRGLTPSRTWLVFTYSPGGATSPTITVPGYGTIAVASPVAGAFYLVSEAGSTVVEVT